MLIFTEQFVTEYFVRTEQIWRIMNGNICNRCHIYYGVGEWDLHCR